MKRKTRAQAKRNKTSRYRAQKKNRVQRKKNLSRHGRKLRREQQKS